MNGAKRRLNATDFFASNEIFTARVLRGDSSAGLIQSAAQGLRGAKIPARSLRAVLMLARARGHV